MLNFLVNKKLLMPFIIFIVLFAALTFNYYRGYAAGTDAQKLIYERQFREKEKEHINQFLQMENAQNQIVKDYQDKIAALEKKHAETMESFEKEQLKIKDSITVTSAALEQCLHKSSSNNSGLPKTSTQSDLVCFRKSDISKRIERTLAVGMKCDKLAEKYNSLLKVCSEF